MILDQILEFGSDLGLFIFGEKSVILIIILSVILNIILTIILAIILIMGAVRGEVKFNPRVVWSSVLEAVDLSPNTSTFHQQITNSH